jgi:hypothetical protein
MMQTLALRSGGHELDLNPEHFGTLCDSSGDLGDIATLRRRMASDGYLYLPGILDRDLVLQARKTITDLLAAEGVLDPAYPTIDAVIRPGRKMSFRPDLTRNNHALLQLLYAEDGELMRFWTAFIGRKARHFDYTWLRTVTPGHGTPSHCDVVYMGRGTSNLYTAWTPLGDVDYSLGGLMVLEGSHNHQRLRQTYCQMDVDSYCVNRDGPAGKDAWARGRGGWLSKDPNQIRQSLGGRWLTGEYHAGDVLVFSIFTVHASLDNTTADRIRFSSDSRYQPEDEPIDERWIGENPTGHGSAGKRGRVC